MLVLFLIFAFSGCVRTGDADVTQSTDGTFQNSSDEILSEQSSSEISSKESSDEEVSSQLPESSVVTQTESETIGNLSAETVKNLKALNNTKRGWGQGVNKDELNRPTGSLSAQDEFGKYNAKYIMPNEKKIYLTFDEGYENGYTSKILDTLKEKEVSAVFFITLPYAKQNKALVKRMIDEGHIVGNHSSKHLSFPTMSLKAAHDDIMNLHNYVLDEFGYEMKLFRFPMGEHSVRTLSLVKELGYESVFWSYAYKDWDPENQPSYDDAFTKVTTNVHNGALYLLHAVSKTNTEILSDVIEKFRQDGYTIEKYPV